MLLYKYLRKYQNRLFSLGKFNFTYLFSELGRAKYILVKYDLNIRVYFIYKRESFFCLKILLLFFKIKLTYFLNAFI